MDVKTSFSDDSQSCEDAKLSPYLEKIDSQVFDDLPPTDGGLHAWLFLAASAMIEALFWGKS